MFEMYPIGMTSIAAFLERNHYNVQILNLAYRMLHEPSFDVPACLAAIDAPVIGLDLHWLPHVQGTLAVAALLKTLHPATKVLVGGLSASYYHEELVRHPAVDFVIRGDSTEEPVRQLLQAIREAGPLESVENLTWKRADGSVVVNPLTFVPETLDYVDVPAYDYVLRSVFKYGSLDNLMPTLEWLRQPITLLLSARGCAHDCAICGGSRSAYRRICGRTRPAFRSADKLAEDIRRITSFSRRADLHGSRPTHGRHAERRPVLLAARGDPPAERDDLRALRAGRRSILRHSRAEHSGVERRDDPGIA